MGPGVKPCDGNDFRVFHRANQLSRHAIKQYELHFSSKNQTKQLKALYLHVQDVCKSTAWALAALLFGGAEPIVQFLQ